MKIDSSALFIICANGACVDVPQNPPSPPAIVAEFEPGATVPIVPTPNDLAKDPTSGLIVVPPSPGESPAQRELEQLYLGTLTGYPFESSAQALVTGDLNPATVNAQTVLAFDLGTPSSPSLAPVSVSPAYDAVHRAIDVPPPSGMWTRAHTYAVVLVGGASGLGGASGESVIGSETWALVSSSTPLVTCTDLSSAECRPAVDVIPSTQTDPAARLADQTSKAISLERLRLLYAPLLDALVQRGLGRDAIALAWTFTIVDAGEATFDPASGVIPFPNDALRVNGKVNMPNPKTLQPLSAADCAAPTDPLVAITCGLNTLDGFSTLAPLVSESSATLGAAMQATLAPSSLGTSSVGLARLATQAASGEVTPVQFTPCLNCASTATTPQELQWQLAAPLDERTTYAAWVTTDVTDDQGKHIIASPAFALLRLANPLFDGTHTLVNLLTDAQAQQLEPLRLALKPALDALTEAGAPRTRLALAFAFTTQSEAAVLDQLYGYPSTIGALPAAPVYVIDATAQYQARASSAGIPFAAVSKVFIGEYVTPVAVTGPGGTLDVTNPTIEPVPFVLYLPAAAQPLSGYPLTIFGHGFLRSDNDSLALANALASAGQATIAADALFHGERSSCTGSHAATAQTSDDASCANPTAQTCNEDPLIGRCVARSASSRAACGPSSGDPTGDLMCAALGQGRCVALDQKCEGGDFLRDASGLPVISGWNLLNLGSFFATRDNLRQDVIDLAQLERVIAGQGTASLSSWTGAVFDPQHLGYVGQNLGSIGGALFNAVSPRTTHVVLNTGGGSLVQWLMNAPAFAAPWSALLANLAALGLHPGTQPFDQLLGIAQWILDPADPANVGYRLTHGITVNPGPNQYLAPNASRAALLQFIQGDVVVPNASSLTLVAAANPSFTPTPPSFGCLAPLWCYELTEAGEGFDPTTATPPTRDAFLLRPPQGSAGLSITSKAQLQVATFLATGVLP